MPKAAISSRSLLGVFAFLAMFEAYSACVGSDRIDAVLGSAQFAVESCGTCVALDQCHDVGICNTETGLCSNPLKADGTTCSDGKACTTGDTCTTGVCGGTVSCPASDQCHTAGACAGDGSCTNPAKADGTTCSDGDLCTQTDTCQGGACSGSNPVVCTATTCKVAGTCAPATGVCSTPTNAMDGTTCNDGNACTLTDSCMSGSCVGSNPKSCAGGDVCNSGSTCNPTTGSCGGGAPMNEGGACTDGNKCTIGDKCASGTCVGAAVDCTSSNPCQVGACDGTTGACVYQNVADNTACNDGKACTAGDKCTAGVCAGTVSCPAIDQCHDVGACAVDNSCTKPVKGDGSSCDYEKWVNPAAASDRCATPNDTCKTGVCTADPNPVVCPQQDCNTVSCVPSTGNCAYAPLTPGTACGVTGCYTSGTCSTVSGKGQCSGTPKDCAASDAVCKAGVCDSGNGACTGLNVPNGTSCATGDKCLIAPSCQAGACIGEPKTCAVSAECRVAMCNSTTGACDEAVAPVGTPCRGVDQCQTSGSCDVTGACVLDPTQDGTPCAGKECPTSGACVTNVCICVSHGSGDLPDMATVTVPPAKSGGCTMAGGGHGADLPGLLIFALFTAVIVLRRRATA